jgi:hypothetical protein
MAKAKWSILFYIAAHNDLHAFGEASLKQIWSLGSSPDVKFTALLDTMFGANRYDSSGPDDGEIRKVEAFDSGDPRKLTQLAKWAFQTHPAERYGLVLWSHGTGWMPSEIERIARQARGDRAVSEQEATERASTSASPALFRSTLQMILKAPTPAERAICFDDGSQHSLDTVELERVAGTVSEAIGQPLDLLGMDACLMASLEVAYQLRHTVRYLVASEELVPGTSWPYSAILNALRKNADMSAADAACLIVREFVTHYSSHRPELNRGDVTKVALDLAKIDRIADAADALAEALLEDIDAQRDRMWAAQFQTQKVETRNKRRKPSKFDFHLWDVATFARRLAQDNPNPGVRAAAGGLVDAMRPGDAVLQEGHLGEWFDGLGGLSIYLAPPNVSRITPYYPLLAFANDTRWDKLLAVYHRQ